MADISVANGGQTAAVALVTQDPKTTPLAALLSTIQQQLNDNVQGYPLTAAAMAAAVQFGAWDSGWLFNIASGNDAGLFGGVTMTAGGTPVYGLTGPRAGIDKAVGFDSLTDEFQAGDNYDVTATDDLCIAWVGMWTAHPTAVEMMVVKRNVGPNGYTLFVNGASGLRWDVHSASGAVILSADITSLVGKWHAGMAVIDRSTGKSRVAVRALDGSASLLTSEGTLFVETSDNADNLQVGNRTNLPATSWRCAALYVAHGPGAATGMSANLSTALTNFAAAVNASWAVTQSPTTGLVSIGYATPPAGAPSFSLDWTNTTLRDLLGFSRNINYPTTAAEVAADIGYGTWTSGAGWLCNEASGNLAAAFGSPTLAASGTPTYSSIGPRGGPDGAIGFAAGADRFSGGNVFDVTATADLAVALVVNVASTPAGSNDRLISKYNGAGAGWQVSLDTSGNLTLTCFDSGALLFTATVANQTATWCAIIAVVDRSTGKGRIGICPLGGAPTVSAEQTCAATSMSNAVNFQIGDRADLPGAAPTTAKIAAVYVVTGSGVATGLSANLSTALSNFAAKFAQTQTGKVEAFASSAKYARMMSALLPPGKLWR